MPTSWVAVKITSVEPLVSYTQSSVRVPAPIPIINDVVSLPLHPNKRRACWAQFCLASSAPVVP